MQENKFLLSNCNIGIILVDSVILTLMREEKLSELWSIRIGILPIHTHELPPKKSQTNPSAPKKGTTTHCHPRMPHYPTCTPKYPHKKVTSTLTHPKISHNHPSHTKKPVTHTHPQKSHMYPYPQKRSQAHPDATKFEHLTNKLSMNAIKNKLLVNSNETRN